LSWRKQTESCFFRRWVDCRLHFFIQEDGITLRIAVFFWPVRKPRWRRRFEPQNKAALIIPAQKIVFASMGVATGCVSTA
jgi:hypothetical protein